MSAVGVGRVGIEAHGVSPTVSVRSAMSVVMTGALLATVTGLEVTGALREAAVVDGDAHADEIAPVAVAGGGEVERRGGGTRDVGAVASSTGSWW